MGQAGRSSLSSSNEGRPADWSIGWTDFIRQAGEAGQANDPEALLLHYYQLVHSSNDAIIAVSADGVIISWNPAAEAAFGTPAERAVGVSIFNVLPHLASDHLPYLIGEALERRRTHAVGSTRRHAADNSRVIVSIVASPMLEDDRVVGVSLIARECFGGDLDDAPLRQNPKSNETCGPPI